MLDDYKENQPIAYRILKKIIDNNKYSHAYLFETHGSTDSLEFVKAFVKSVLCPNKLLNNKDCENCNKCQIIDDENNVELKIIKPDGLWIKKEQLVELQNEFSTKAICGTKKIYIITNADRMNDSSANSILKFLEEPEENIIAILMVDNKYQLLDTITSRCQIISLLEKKISDNSSLINKINETINSSKIDEDNLEKIINFVDYYEKNGLDTILNTQKLWHQYFLEKELISDAFEVMVLYYLDITNASYNYNIKIFKEYEKNIDTIKNKNTIKVLLDKINVILNIKELIKYNVNTNLLIDKLIFELKEVEK